MIESVGGSAQEVCILTVTSVPGGLVVGNGNRGSISPNSVLVEVEGNDLWRICAVAILQVVALDR